MSKNVDIGPWPQGEDNVHSEEDAVFQQGKKPTQRLLKAINIDLRDDGWPLRRNGTISVQAVTAGRSLFSGNGLLLYQDGGSIYSLDPDTPSATELVSGLNPDDPVKFLSLADQIFWLNRSTTGRFLPDGTLAPWGLPTPLAPTLVPQAGSLCPGTYLVAFAYLDAYGIEHSLSPVTASTVGNNSCSGPGPATGFSIMAHNVPANVAKVRIYISQANGSELYFVADATPNAFPILVTNGGHTPWSDVEPVGLYTHPPIPGDGLFAFRGMVLTYTDNMLFASLGPAHHLFEVGTVVEARPDPILGGEGLIDGFWTTTRNGAYWTSGTTPNTWDTNQKDGRCYARGSFLVNGRFLPEADTTEKVVVFVSNEGLIVGKPGGQLQPLTQDRYHFDVEEKHATFMMREQRGMRQLLFTLN